VGWFAKSFAQGVWRLLFFFSSNISLICSGVMTPFNAEAVVGAGAGAGVGKTGFDNAGAAFSLNYGDLISDCNSIMKNKQKRR